MIDIIRELNALGFVTFPTRNKKPVEGCLWKELSPEPFADESQYSTGQYAIRLRPDDLVIDVDPRNFPKGRNIWKEFKETFSTWAQDIDKRSFVVRSGSGGAHIYLKKSADTAVHKSIDGFPGIDFLGATKTKARYVIGPGSNHESGKNYTVFRGKPSDIKDAPPELIALIEKKEVKTVDAPAVVFSDDKQNIGRYIEYLEKTDGAVQGLSGDETTFTTACRGRDYGLTQDKTFELMLKHYNPKCIPPWLENELWLKVTNAYKYSVSPAGVKTPEIVFTETEKPGALEYDKLKALKSHPKPASLVVLNNYGRPKPLLLNAVIYLTLKTAISENLQFNELSHSVEVIGELPWHKHRAGKGWNDGDTTLCKYYMAEQYIVEFSTATMLEAVYIVASRRSYHPVRQYLDKLVWDKKPRLKNWLVRYCGAVDCSYTSAVGIKTLTAAVARVYEPGCKFDHVLILEGKQRIGKSMTCSILGGEWFGDFKIDPGNKDTVDAMRGKWIIELAEMSVLRKKQEVEELRAFITRTTDRVRFAYARMTTDMPRQSVFIGTVNPENVGYLVDRTGNGRFWPVLCDKIDIEALQQDRDQLFAEAIVRYQNGEKLFIEDVKLRQEVEARADERVEEDPWIELIGDWSVGAGKDVQEITTTKVYENVLGGMPKNITRFDQIRVGKALLGCGWFKHRTSSGNVYKRGEHQPYPEVNFK